MSEILQFLSSIPIRFKAAPPWKQCLEKAKRESDSRKLLARVYDTESALFKRWREIGNDGTQVAERQAMNAAADDLWCIKIYKLGWPGPRP